MNTNTTTPAQKVSFIDDLKATIKDRLADYAGGTYYGCDLAYTLFEGENANGTVLFSTYQTKQFISENFDLFGDLVEYAKDNFDMTLNPFAEPEKAHVILLLESAQSLLAKLPFIDENWNENIELTDEVVEMLCSQIDDLDIEESELF